MEKSKPQQQASPPAQPPAEPQARPALVKPPASPPEAARASPQPGSGSGTASTGVHLPADLGSFWTVGGEDISLRAPAQAAMHAAASNVAPLLAAAKPTDAPQAAEPQFDHARIDAAARSWEGHVGALFDNVRANLQSRHPVWATDEAQRANVVRGLSRFVASVMPADQPELPPWADALIAVGIWAAPRAVTHYRDARAQAAASEAP